MTLNTAGRLGLFALVTLASATLSASAEDIIYTVNNDSSQDITEMYTSPVNAADWQNNLLSEVLPAGGNATVTLADGETTCDYDLRFVTSEGQELVEPDVNVCEIESYTVLDK